ncbi:MAG: 4-hydroxy-tetrahydrodipicolinate synthase [Armatimonadota bacterium]|nr:4-hydroxy-tetrahydrodipicolinate synthase [Armatimonadota bacterium]MDR7421737.1 4-hydroxy-tetrahydrodipicolinate synthase [Armatimonadota bacterium]MDR7453710.1 4-hydroxy-tetrahydrodipicolinate synthase [Armatimonadota bacterium]MDR7456415.1 4-hydroxy-tetrahydrodipicolinate synthase [Armatimonadota bacterium]MDR7497811.1 4-hydroxy-tetrahydrodipicolinate synthase [Armatimonadota bacterium]
MALFGHVITAMVTPFDVDGRLDERRAALLARRLIDRGNDALVVAGTTGESPTLSDDEKVRLFRTVKEAVGERGKVIAGTGTYDTAHSIHLSREAHRAGADGLLLVNPYYNRPSQDGLYAHFRAVAESTPLPVMLYNIPGRTGVNCTPETIARLAQVPNIVAVKEAAGSLDQVSEIRVRTPDAFLIYSGDDSLTLPKLAVGATGVVSVAGNLVPGEIKRMIEAYIAGRPGEALRLHRRLWPLFKVLFITTNPVPVKAALRLSGFDCGRVRLPLVDATPKEEEQIRTVLEALDLVPTPA